MRYLLHGIRAADGSPITTTVFALDDDHARCLAGRLGLKDAAVERLTASDDAQDDKNGVGSGWAGSE